MSKTKKKRLTRTRFISLLEALGACKGAKRWVKKKDATPAKLWATCRKLDWMLWLTEKTNLKHESTCYTCAWRAQCLAHVMPLPTAQHYRDVVPWSVVERGLVRLREFKRLP